MKYQMNKGCKDFGVVHVFENANFEIKNNEKIAIVGRNGCGKTTFLKIMADEEVLDSGNIYIENNTSIGYLAQTTFEDEELSVYDALSHVFDKVKKMEEELNDLCEQMSYDHSEELLNRYANLQHSFEELNGYGWESEMKNVLTKFNFQIDDLNRPIKTFSGGQKTRLAFVKLLLSKPDILLLDEPTNHLDLETIEWLQGYIKRYPKAVVLVSHDRMFLDEVCDVIYEIEYGVMRKYVGNYTNYVNVKKSDVEQQKSAYIRQQKDIKRLEELIEKFRYKKNKAAFAQSKIKYLDRMEKVEDVKVDNQSFKANFTINSKGGKRVLEVRELSIGYDHELCKVNLDIMNGQKIAVIGPNGHGKSTFLKTLMQLVPKRSGEILFGHQIEVGYFDQDLNLFDPMNTVLEEVWKDFSDLEQSEVRSALGTFLFRGEEVFKDVSVLSGGEKVRLALVKLMLSHPNFLVMDEPTNHLDLVGKEALEESLKDYEGTMLFVSHDRYFISKLADAILVIENGNATYYALNYQEYMEKKQTKQEVVKQSQKQEKKYVRNFNYGKEIKKLEKKIEDNETKIEELKQLRFDPSYYEDYKKMQKLDEEIESLELEVVEMMALWEEYSEMM